MKAKVYLVRSRAERQQITEQAAVLREDGLTYRDVAERVGVSAQVVHRLLNPYVAETERRKKLGRRVVDRECAAVCCNVVIDASAKADKEYCSPQCGARMRYLRKVGMA